jgi:raffinose/stachyose/melibiose transport system substrate-binding protein
MKFRVYAVRFTILISVLAMVLSGCVPAVPAGTGDGVDAAPEPVEITVWYSQGLTSECRKVEAVDTFNESQDGVFVNVEFKATAESLRPALAAGEGPDVVQLGGPVFAAELALAGQLLPLDDYAAEFNWGDLFHEWGYNVGLVEGKLYSLAQELETLVLFYNKTVFEENGWTPPTNMAEFQELAAVVDSAGYIPFAGQSGQCSLCNEWYVGEFLNHVAGPELVYQALIGEVPWTHPDFVQSIDIHNDLMQAGYYMGSLERFQAATFDEFTTAFATGEAVMNMEGTWFYGREADYFGEGTDHGNEWDWVPMPSVSGETIFSIGLGGTQSISANSENPREAAMFLNHYFSPEVQGRLLSVCNYGTAPVRGVSDFMEGVDPRMQAIFAAMNDAFEQGIYGYTLWTFFPPKTDTYMHEELEKVWSGQMTAEEYMAGIEEIFQEELAAGEVPPTPKR